MVDVFIGDFSLDAIAPQVTNRVPNGGDVGVLVTANVNMDITDTGGSGLDPTSVQIYINAVLAYDGGMGGCQPGFSCTVTPIVDGFTYSIDPAASFPYLTLIPVSVVAADNEGNTTSVTYSFTTESPVVSALWMDLTTEGATRISEISSGGLKFFVSHVAYGAYGYIPSMPTVAYPLVPSATSLVAEVYRKVVPRANTVIDVIASPRGRETTYTTVGGDEFTDILGEAGLFATVTDPGTTGLPLGYVFLLAQAHFPRIVFSLYCRLAIVWPINYNGALLYDSPIIYDDIYSFNG
jgi:hypothetical protein